MPRYILALLVVLSAGAMAVTNAAAIQEDPVRDGLARASALYYEANFKESIDVLLHLDDTLKVENGRLAEKAGVKLQLALAYVALNDSVQARSRFDELYSLDPDYSIDRQQYAPKVLTLAEEAKAEQEKIRTLRKCDDLRKQVENENPAVSVDQIISMKSRCSDLPLFVSKAADLFYKKGLEAYKRNEFAAATQLFRSALKLEPEHELAAQYADLIQQKTRLSGDRLLMEWKKNFDNRDFPAASAAYKQLDSLNIDGALTPSLTQARSEYHKALLTLVQSWNRSCAAADAAGMSNLRKQAGDMLPDRSLDRELLDQMTCAAKPESKASAAASASASNPGGKPCLQMDSRLALVRLKTRVDPVVPSVVLPLLRRSSMTVRVQAHIDETGGVTIVQATGENSALNSAVRSAVERWKFLPAILQDETRCVDTEIPVVIGLDSTR